MQVVTNDFKVKSLTVKMCWILSKGQLFSFCTAKQVRVRFRFELTAVMVRLALGQCLSAAQ